MADARVIIDFSKYKLYDLETIAGIVITACTDNPYFQFSENLISEARALLTLFTQHLELAKGGGITANLLKNQTKRKLLKKMKQIAMEANLLADGDELKLSTTKIPFARRNTTPIPGKTATGLRAKNTETPNEVEVSTDVPDGAYVGTYFAIAEDNENTPADINKWIIIFVTGSKGTFTDLKSGVLYWLSAAHKGGDNNEKPKWCPPIKFRVL